MTNEEKKNWAISLEISEKYNRTDQIVASGAAMQMANWKDKQFKEYLEKKKSEYGIDYNVNPIDMLNEIINELFPKEETDCSNNDE